jgi:hypothetical protein
MVREHHKCIDSEWMALPSRRDRLAQLSNMVNEQGLMPLKQVDREEPTATWNECTTIVRHEMQRST